MSAPAAPPALILLPPAPATCPACATAHPPEAPHNRDSLYYQMAFRQQTGRWPTWADACGHCDEAWRATVRAVVTERGVSYDE